MNFIEQTWQQIISSKTNWTIFTGLVVATVSYNQDLITAVEYVTALFNGLGVFFVRDTIVSLKK